MTRSPAADQDASEDFRVRAAARKREAMRQRLLDATLAACSAETIRNPALIDDVIRLAEVSRGTFYKYFDSMEEATRELGRVLMREMVDNVALVLQDIRSPAERVIAGPLLYLARAAQDAQWGAFVSGIDHLAEGPHERLIQHAIARDLLEAREQQVLSFPSLELAMDLLVGAARQAVQRIVREGRGDADRILEYVVMVMLALGMTRARARRAVQAIWAHLQQSHPQSLPWLTALLQAQPQAFTAA